CRRADEVRAEGDGTSPRPSAEGRRRARGRLVIDPPRWSSDELERDRLIAIEAFREERMREPLERYLELFDERRGHVEDLLETLVDMDLTKVDDEAIVSVLTNPALLEAFRYLPGPMISKDDLSVLAQTSLARTSMSKPEKARVVFKTI